MNTEDVIWKMPAYAEFSDVVSGFTIFNASDDLVELANFLTLFSASTISMAYRGAHVRFKLSICISINVHVFGYKMASLFRNLLVLD